MTLRTALGCALFCFVTASASEIRLARTEFRTADADAIAAAIPEPLRGGPVDAGGLLLVRLAASVPATERAAVLERHGALAIEPIPDRAWLARVPAASVPALRSDAAVEWIGRFHPAWKLSPLLDGSETRLRVRRAGGAVAVETGDAGALARLDDVLFVEPDFEPTTFNDQSRGIVQSSNPALYPVHVKGVRGAGQIVAVMDTGIDTRHCCFDARDKIVDNRAWGGGTLGASCGSDHGSHVAGTVACENRGDHDGLAPDAQLILQDIQSSGSLACLVGSVSPPSPLSSAWADARQRGARVHTNSWGGGGNAYGSDAAAIDDYMWQNPDFLILYAAGNSGPGAGTLGAYSNAKNSITVGGTINGSSYESMYGSSSRGPAGDGRLLPDLLAPAQGVSSVDNQSTASCGWTTFSGTSMATPAVAGAAALVREYFGKGYWPRGTATSADAFQPTAALVKATLLISTRDMLGSGTGGPRPNPDQGFGRTTLDDALWFVGDDPGARVEILDDRSASTGMKDNGEEHVFELRLTEAGPVKVMLAWTDAPGSPAAAKALVNDLDLVVETPDGRRFLGNRGFEGGFTTVAAADGDRLNNKEAVFLPSVAPGTVTVRVRAVELGNVGPQKPQDYALVATAPVDPLCAAEAPAGVGNSATLAIAGAGLRATWADRAASSYVVYRGTTPDFMRSNPAPYRENVTDEDPAEPGIQWTDPSAYGDGASYYYLFNARNSCGEQAP